MNLGLEILKKSGDEGIGNNFKDFVKILSREGETKRLSLISDDQFNFVFELYMKYQIYFQHRKGKKCKIPQVIETYLDLAVSETSNKETALIQLLKEAHQAQIIQDITEKKV